MSNPITVCHDDLDWSARAVLGEGSQLSARNLGTGPTGGGRPNALQVQIQRSPGQLVENVPQLGLAQLLQEQQTVTVALQSDHVKSSSPVACGRLGVRRLPQESSQVVDAFGNRLSSRSISVIRAVVALLVCAQL